MSRINERLYKLAWRLHQEKKLYEAKNLAEDAKAK